MITISKMKGSDTAFAAELAQKEGWGHQQFDYQRLLSFEPDGCFIAGENNQPVGMITSTSFDNYAFLASLIVLRDERGRGIGEKLLKTAIDYLHGNGINSIELDGVIDAVPLYRKLGFVDKYLSLRLIRNPADSTRAVKSTTQYVANDVVEFDKEMIGLNRCKVISHFLSEFEDGLIKTGDNKIDAYAMIRPRPEGPYYIGPLVARDRQSFEKILTSIFEKYNEVPLKIGVPEINRDAVDILIENGFEYLQPSLRMYLGNKLDYEKHIYGILSAEKG